MVGSSVEAHGHVLLLHVAAVVFAAVVDKDVLLGVVVVASVVVAASVVVDGSAAAVAALLVLVEVGDIAVVEVRVQRNHWKKVQVLVLDSSCEEDMSWAPDVVVY